MDINISNVTYLARALLQCETQHIQERYQSDIASSALSLKKSLDQYENPQPLYNWINFSAIERFEQDIKSLIAQTQAFWSLLTPEAQSMVENHHISRT